jgi:hypothetical protein
LKPPSSLLLCVPPPSRVRVRVRLGLGLGLGAFSLLCSKREDSFLPSFLPFLPPAADRHRNTHTEKEGEEERKGSMRLWQERGYIEGKLGFADGRKEVKSSSVVAKGETSDRDERDEEEEAEI